MILLDTSIWLWLLHDPSRLQDAASKLIAAEEEQNGLLISAISVWEVAITAVTDWVSHSPVNTGVGV